MNRSRHPLARGGTGRSWRHWLRTGALSGAVLGGLPPGPAHAQPPMPPRYAEPISFGVSVGGALAPTLKVSYGLDVRYWRGPSVGFIRVEGRSLTHVRLVGGLQMPAKDDFFAEVGLAWHSGHHDGQHGPGLGPYAGAGLWRSPFTFSLGGTPILLGDRGNYDVGLAATVLSRHGYSIDYSRTSAGRPLRAADEMVLPAALAWWPWAPGTDAAGAPRAAEHAALATERLEAARMEHASIHAFVRMAAELAAVGAPAALVEQATAAAREEAEHTAICLALADIPALLLPLPEEAARSRFIEPSPQALACLAREAWADGCLGEGTAAARARLAAAGATRSDAARAERQIARDEQGHAELSWRVLEWLWRHGGPGARDALAAATEAAQPTGSATPPPDLDEDYLTSQGLVPPHLQRRAAEEVLDRALSRLRHLGLPA